MQEPTNSTILEVINNFASDVQDQFDGMQKEFGELRQELHQEIGRIDRNVSQIHVNMKEMEERLVGHIDGLANEHRRQDIEIIALRSKTQRHESHIQQIAKHINIKLD